MQYRTLGRTGLRVSEVGFGCGNIGGLMVRGTHDLQVAAVKHAVESGINYFDTAAQYGDGRSETNLGAVLQELKPDVHVGTKFRLRADDLADIPGSVRRALETSLGRLQMQRVDLFQLHNRVADELDKESAVLGVEEVLGKGGVADALDGLRSEGLIGAAGFTGLGETGAVLQLVDSRFFESVQCYYNLLNATAGEAGRSTPRIQDYRSLIDRASRSEMGVIAIRVLAGGALGGAVARQGFASPTVGRELSRGSDYDMDVNRAGALGFLTSKSRSLPQSAVRFVLDNPQVSVALVGYSEQAQLDQAIAAAEMGPFTGPERNWLSELWTTDFGLSPTH